MPAAGHTPAAERPPVVSPPAGMAAYRVAHDCLVCPRLLPSLWDKAIPTALPRLRVVASCARPVLDCPSRFPGGRGEGSHVSEYIRMCACLCVTDGLDPVPSSLGSGHASRRRKPCAQHVLARVDGWRDGRISTLGTSRKCGETEEGQDGMSNGDLAPREITNAGVCPRTSVSSPPLSVAQTWISSASTFHARPRPSLLSCLPYPFFCSDCPRCPGRTKNRPPEDLGAKGAQREPFRMPIILLFWLSSDVRCIRRPGPEGGRAHGPTDGQAGGQAHGRDRDFRWNAANHDAEERRQNGRRQNERRQRWSDRSRPRSRQSSNTNKRPGPVPIKGSVSRQQVLSCGGRWRWRGSSPTLGLYCLLVLHPVVSSLLQTPVVLVFRVRLLPSFPSRLTAAGRGAGTPQRLISD